MFLKAIEGNDFARTYVLAGFGQIKGQGDVFKAVDEPLQLSWERFMTSFIPAIDWVAVD